MVLCGGKKRACSIVVGALALVFEKSATELKLIEKILKFKGAMHIAVLKKLELLIETVI